MAKKAYDWINASINDEKEAQLDDFNSLFNTIEGNEIDKLTDNEDLDLIILANAIYAEIEASIKIKIVLDNLKGTLLNDGTKNDIINDYNEAYIQLFEEDLKTNLINRIKDKVRGLE